MSECFNIFMAGVGGQGIGLLSELMARAALNAGWTVHACDTHGLAQRGGMVTSHLRLGDSYSPLVPDGQADLVLALERTEALRAIGTMLKDHGAIAWYDAAWQALDVRSGSAKLIAAIDVEAAATKRNARFVKVFREDLPDSRMQNSALVAAVLKAGLVPRLELKHVQAAMKDLLAGSALEANLALL